MRSFPDRFLPEEQRVGEHQNVSKADDWWRGELVAFQTSAVSQLAVRDVEMNILPCFHELRAEPGDLPQSALFISAVSTFLQPSGPACVRQGKQTHDYAKNHPMLICLQEKGLRY